MERTKYQILRALVSGPMSFWQLVEAQDSTLIEATQTIGLMLTQGEILFDPKSRKFTLGKPCGLLSEGEGACPSCVGRGVVVSDGRFLEALERFLKLIEDRPPPVFEYNQGLIQPQDLARKAVVMDRRGDLEGRSILLFGDDDLFSLFLALLGLGPDLTVLEIDDRLIGYIKDKAGDIGVLIRAIRYDVGTPLPLDLRATCDVFVTEPPEGLKGMLLFLRRAIDALRMGGSGYFGLTTLESSLPKWHVIQRFLVENGMVVTDLLRGFSLYPEAADPVKDYERFPISRAFPVAPGPPDIDYFRSALIRVEKTNPRSASEGGDLYTDEDTSVTINPKGAA